MGIAAYNRTSRAIREQFDQEIRERREVIQRVATRHQCERCFGKLGVRLDRGCTWSNRLSKWINACMDCRRKILNENAGR